MKYQNNIIYFFITTKYCCLSDFGSFSYGLLYNNASEHVCVFLGEIVRDLPHSVQLYWSSFNISPKGKEMSKTYFERSMLGVFSNTKSPDLVLSLYLPNFKEMAKGWELFYP